MTVMVTDESAWSMASVLSPSSGALGLRTAILTSSSTHLLTRHEHAEQACVARKSET